MPLIVLLLMLAPLPLAIESIQTENTKELKVNEICAQKFKDLNEIKQCKTILMKIER